MASDQFQQEPTNEPPESYGAQVAPGPPPPAKKKGMHPLLMCVLIGCAAVVVLIIIVVIWFMNSFGGAVKTAQDVQTTDLATIQSAAMPVDGQTLAQGISGYDGKWLELTGTASDMGADPAAGSMGQGQVYMLESGVMLQDLSGTASLQSGDMCRAWGKVIEMEFSGERVIFFMAKSVELVE